MEKEFLSLDVNISKTYLSSKSKIYKTERFFFQTKKISEINFFILKIAETMLGSISEIEKQFLKKGNDILKIETTDGAFQFFAKIKSDTNDIIFINSNEFTGLKQNDQRVNFFLRTSKIFKILVSASDLKISEGDFKKLYLISSSEYVNFPLLSEEQSKLVEIENQNVLIQGVAGSGKTNICYSKIIYTACRNYSGKVLYTTFSRGLLIDTKTKIEFFKNSIKKLIDDYRANRIVFLDKDHKKAIENRLGIYIVADNETNIIKKLVSVADFLENNVEYKLIEDIAHDYFDEELEVSSEETFIHEFLPHVSDHRLKSRLEKIKGISYSVIYKEIYGMIFGNFENAKENMLSKEKYIQLRKNSFSYAECEVIYDIAVLFDKFQKANNHTDNNKISRRILNDAKKLFKYSLIIADEVQDFTQINLNLFKEISIKMFCVGDALQMINPSYFSFAYLKKLMYNEDVTNVIELESNYRNNKKIVEVLDNLSKINKEKFGTHSFVLSCKSVDENGNSNTIYTADKQFLDKLASEKFEDYTLLVSDDAEKQRLRKNFKKQEILTISEIKGLERETVVLTDVLSANFSKWQMLERLALNHKQADENSVFRYYFNLFYVGLSRAKHNIFVYESKAPSSFENFFKENFKVLNAAESFKNFESVVSKLEIDQDEIYERINEFIKLGQFDNAKFYAKKLGGFEEIQQTEKIEAYKNFVFKGKNKQAGIKLWKVGLIEEAKEQFLISGETKLIEFLDSLETKNQTNLDGEIVRFWSDFEDNADAREIIIETLVQELETMKNIHNETKQKLSKFKEKK